MFNYEITEYYIKNIILLGADYDENLNFHHYKSNISFNKYKNLPIEYISDSKLLKQKSEIKKFLEDSKKKEIYEYDRHHCFFKNSGDFINCKSPKLSDTSIGIWDDPCVYNEDCPFYKSNLNYKNNRGGCVNGYCEMPINVNILGYKEYSNSDKKKAICYNCKRKPKCRGMECNMCCEEQKNKNNYPNLLGPDYAFKYDFNERLENRKEFEEKNISPIKLLS